MENVMSDDVTKQDSSVLADNNEDCLGPRLNDEMTQEGRVNEKGNAFVEEDIKEQTPEVDKDVRQQTAEAEEDMKQQTADVEEDTKQQQQTAEAEEDMKQQTDDPEEDKKQQQQTAEAEEDMKQQTADAEDTKQQQQTAEAEEDMKQQTADAEEDTKQQQQTADAEEDTKQQQQTAEAEEDMKQQTAEAEEDMKQQTAEAEEDIKQQTADAEEDTKQQQQTAEAEEDMKQQTAEAEEDMKQQIAEAEEDMKQQTAEAEQDMKQQTAEAEEDMKQQTADAEEDTRENTNEEKVEINDYVSEEAAEDIIEQVLDDTIEELKEQLTAEAGDSSADNAEEIDDEDLQSWELPLPRRLKTGGPVRPPDVEPLSLGHDDSDDDEVRGGEVGSSLGGDSGEESDDEGDGDEDLTAAAGRPEALLSLCLHELASNDARDSWNEVYRRGRNEASSEATTSAARQLGSRQRNRYRDVLPYDHSRVRLLPPSNTGSNSRSDNFDDDNAWCDYINASLVTAAHANRAYVMTQGPLPSTSGHFWQMVWQLDSPGVVMLSRLVEKATAKCHQYYPNQRHPKLDFPDEGLSVELTDLQTHGYYLIRKCRLTLTSSGDTRDIVQFQYLTWPDFGVPHTPGAFLNFLMAVRRAGLLSDCLNRPPVVHCSAGIGRTGTFALVDVCLALLTQRCRQLAEVEAEELQQQQQQQRHQRSSVQPVDLGHELRQLRRNRMGLVQTPDQLRFCYLAVAAAGRRVLVADLAAASTLDAADAGSLEFRVDSTEIAAANSQQLVDETYYDDDDDDSSSSASSDGKNDINNPASWTACRPAPAGASGARVVGDMIILDERVVPLSSSSSSSSESDRVLDDEELAKMLAEDEAESVAVKDAAGFDEAEVIKPVEVGKDTAVYHDADVGGAEGLPRMAVAAAVGVVLLAGLAFWLLRC